MRVGPRLSLNAQAHSLNDSRASVVRTVDGVGAGARRRAAAVWRHVQSMQRAPRHNDRRRRTVTPARATGGGWMGAVCFGAERGMDA
jgi:hypothetical protein